MIDPYDMPTTGVTPVYVEEIDNITEEIELTLAQLNKTEVVVEEEIVDGRKFDESSLISTRKFTTFHKRWRKNG